MLKAIIFDAYGTLISTGNGSIEAARKILALNNRLDISAEKFYEHWKKYHRYHISSLNQFINEAAIFSMDLEKLYIKFHMNRDPKIDVNIMLNTLENRIAFSESKDVLQWTNCRLTTCIGSTTDTQPLLQNMERNQLFVDKVFTSEMLQVYKPNKIFYQSIINDLHIAATDVIFIGDSLIDDVYGPQSVGMKTCWINRKGQKNASIKPDYEISDLKELYNIINSLLEDI